MGPVLSSQPGGTPCRAAAAMTLDVARGTGTAVGSPRIPNPIPFTPSAHPPSHCVVPSIQRFLQKGRAQTSTAAAKKGCAVDVVEQWASTQQRAPRRSAVRLADKRRAAFHSALTASLHRIHQDFLAHVLPPAPQSQPAAAHIHPSPQSRRSAFPVAAASGMGCASRGLRGEESQHGAAGAEERGSEAEKGEQECSAVPAEERMEEEGRFEAGGVDLEESGIVRGGRGRSRGVLHTDTHGHAGQGRGAKGGKGKQQREARVGRQNKQRRKGGAAGDESDKTGEVEEGAMEGGERAEEGEKKAGSDGGAGSQNSSSVSPFLLTPVLLPLLQLRCLSASPPHLPPAVALGIRARSPWVHRSCWSISTRDSDHWVRWVRAVGERGKVLQGRGEGCCKGGGKGAAREGGLLGRVDTWLASGCKELPGRFSNFLPPHASLFLCYAHFPAPHTPPHTLSSLSPNLLASPSADLPVPVSLPPYLPASLPPCRPTSLSPSLPASPSAYLPTSPSAYLPTSLPPYLPVGLPIYRSASNLPHQVVHCEELPQRKPRYGNLASQLCPATWHTLARAGVSQLYSHQVSTHGSYLSMPLQPLSLQ
ncbi:unnamed protein product [Closterium sp. Naga37s-1]|nr:unnamed protein product [Closterium sp. Naga37s-1]